MFRVNLEAQAPKCSKLNVVSARSTIHKMCQNANGEQPDNGSVWS